MTVKRALAAFCLAACALCLPRTAALAQMEDKIELTPIKVSKEADRIYAHLLAFDVAQSMLKVIVYMKEAEGAAYMSQSSHSACLGAINDLAAVGRTVWSEGLPIDDKDTELLVQGIVIDKSRGEDREKIQAKLCPQETVVADDLLSEHLGTMQEMSSLGEIIETYGEEEEKRVMAPAERTACLEAEKAYVERYDFMLEAGFPAVNDPLRSQIQTMREEPDRFCPASRPLAKAKKGKPKRAPK